MYVDHPDFLALQRIAAGIQARLEHGIELEVLLPAIIKDAIDFVIDPVKTGRTTIAELDSVEKTFIGLKIEHYFRDLLDVPKGLRDLVIDGIDVDIKNTIGSTWMIPPETYDQAEPCVLIASAEAEGHCSLGLMLAKIDYLGSKNRDDKRSVTALGRRNIMWLVRNVPLPQSRWHGIDMAKFRELRKFKGGNKRAAEFFRQNLGKVVHRSVVQSLLHDQDDYMRRLRGDTKTEGTRDILKKENIELACGVWSESRETVASLGFADLKPDEWVAVRIM